MLKTNSKKAVDNLKAYIMECSGDVVDLLNYERRERGEAEQDTATFAEVSAYIMETFNRWDCDYERRRIPNNQERFVDWSRGLPFSMFDFWNYYDPSPVEIVAKVLEETPTEKNRYTEEEAGVLLVKIIYREILKALRRA